MQFNESTQHFKRPGTLLLGYYMTGEWTIFVCYLKGNCIAYLFEGEICFSLYSVEANLRLDLRHCVNKPSVTMWILFL